MAPAHTRSAHSRRYTRRTLSAPSARTHGGHTRRTYTAHALHAHSRRASGHRFVGAFCKLWSSWTDFFFTWMLYIRAHAWWLLFSDDVDCPCAACCSIDDVWLYAAPASWRWFSFILPFWDCSSLCRLHGPWLCPWLFLLSFFFAVSLLPRVSSSRFFITFLLHFSLPLFFLFFLPVFLFQLFCSSFSSRSSSLFFLTSLPHVWLFLLCLTLLPFDFSSRFSCLRFLLASRFFLMIFLAFPTCVLLFPFFPFDLIPSFPFFLLPLTLSLPLLSLTANYVTA